MVKSLFRRIALIAYWKAKTPRQERWAYWCARKFGLPPAYGEKEHSYVREDFWDYCFPMNGVGQRLPNYRRLWEVLGDNKNS